MLESIIIFLFKLQAMKTLFKTSFLIIGLTIVSCVPNMPISSSVPRNNRTYRVEYLFEHDGCKVYRFNDNGRYVYFTNCTGNITSFQNDSTETRVENVVIKTK